ncbi:hypothetical protein [Actibacterium sp. XHP0104]|uniref:hypothetical protein n=1 Tax=Actibacterium sp. XHP0104 TaxID=2984335 RepID=UPI0021E7AEB0|nr:hypothetical protein [Actibacterium sp. XHP0104]MCV2882397.1 hypothetical protein [Actibacterium sp. XHP0104]
MNTIHPNLFAQLMRLPAGIRVDLLEFLGATPVEDAQLRQMLAEAISRTQPSNPELNVAA